MSFKKSEVSILVVDDEREITDSLVKLLGFMGYNAVGAYGGQDALVRFNETPFQVVISDLVMPDMDGMEFMDSARMIDDRAVFIIMTGYASVDSAVSAMKKGAYDYVVKPVKSDHLELVLKKAEEKYSLSKQLGIFKGMTLALLISVPVWLVLGIVLAVLLR